MMDLLTPPSDATFASAVVKVSLKLRCGDKAARDHILWYHQMMDELAAKLGVARGTRVTMDQVRSAVLELRRGKGMLLDPADHDTWSVGSFFLNPRSDVVPDGAPAWEQPDGRYKVSAAWLIENAGFGKGFGLNERATLSNKHTLAITNRGGATAADILELASFIQTGVKAKYGIALELEPRLVR